MTEGEDMVGDVQLKQPGKKNFLKEEEEEEGIVTWRGERGRGANSCQRLSSP